ncbi:nitrite reductase large subunit NirB [Vallicoccus soli]|uniref:assimilatory sulfite reductase (ferredoxin) n=1 Tax=Vallicoccus soli TaxID=2339232 RepID=A0A3A3Z0R7_9ACTN|nr:nitrite reductase large subunit NirB [Vallicoccus soli]RJK96845.1 nitrite reductase large subunit [Vallicoccus soli]
MTQTLVVAGAGMVGHRLVEALRSRDTAGAWRVVVLGEEPRRPYDRVALSSYAGSWDAGALALGDALYDDPLVELRLGTAVAAVDRAARTVTTRAGDVVAYDALVLATGSRPFVPPVEGRDLPGVFVYRTVEDLDALRAWVARLRAAGRAPRGAVVGGGLLGLEAAGVLRALDVGTTVVEHAPRLMPLQVDEGGGHALRRLVEGLGVEVRTGAMTRRLRAGADGAVAVMELAEEEAGAELPVDVVVVAAGVRPRDELAADSALPLGPRGGVLVDAAGRTPDPAVFAVGECASVEGTVYGLVAPGYSLAEVVADRLLGGDATFPGADLSTKLKLLGVDVASFGDAHAASPGALELVWSDPVAGVYTKLVVSDDARTLLGGVLVGDASAYASLRPLVGTTLDVEPALLVLPAREGGAPALAVPDEATVCSCHNVTRGEVACAVREHGLADVPAVKACTRAGTGCGSCVPLLRRILDDCGVEQSRALCEHFDLTRAELYEVVRATGTSTFSELVARHGRGRGCDVCKPTVASILATLAGGHVLDGERASLQDTNDHHLANLQKDGTYSVVPRVPGGEITPEGLIAIGEVARDFGLYTKITGGQRIDLLGARVEQLPLVWRRLVDAGFESGHAYGKALRTVKSCVGSTWCRYGVQDSVALAIALELRYRGLRAPHKLKSGVSGCARECAEARGKDFGIIATENGWNLYVGGNGGATPRHAELLAQDLDTPTLVRYLDRFLMLYVRTADRLQRTAPWIEAMEGGLDHLRAVVVEDRLGIAADLEAAMERHVASYSDEWKDVLDDPAKLARFASFVNDPSRPDPDVVFVRERGQPRPATAQERAVLVAGPRLEVAR